MSKNTPNACSQTRSFEKHVGYCAQNQMGQKPLILAVETSGRTGSVAIALGEQILAEATLSTPMRHSAEIFPAVCGLLNHLGRKPKEIEHIYISVGPGSFTGLRIAVTMAKTMHLANATKTVAVDTLDVIAVNATDYLYTTKRRKTAIEKIATILDAKRGQFFAAVYQNQRGLRHKDAKQTKNNEYRTRNLEIRHSILDINPRRPGVSVTGNGQWVKILPDTLVTAPQFLEEFAGSDQPIWLLGEGLVYHKDKFNADGIGFLDKRYWNPWAGKVHLLGWKMALAGQFTDALTLKPAYLRRPEAEEKYHQSK